MIFTFLISIVFIAELIIVAAIISTLKRWQKNIRNLNLTLAYLKPSIRDICVLARKISGQIVEFTEDFVQRQKDNVLQNLSRVLLGAVFLRRFKKSKALKLIGKGLSLLEIVV